MKRPNFFEGVIVAVVLSLFGVAFYTMLSLLFNINTVAYLTVTALSSIYLFYLLWRSSCKNGRLTMVLVWGVFVFSIWLISPPFVIYSITHIGALCLVRSYIFHKTVLSASLDLLLCTLGVILAAWAYLITQNLLLSIWCLFLAQALFSLIPARKESQSSNEQQFDDALRNAESALQKLLS